MTVLWLFDIVVLMTNRKSHAIAKINCPKVPDIVHRQRLYSLLDKARARPVLWIAGPGGSGKTTLIASYLELRKLPVLWYQVDAGDADLATFFYYLSLSSKKAAPKVRKSLPLLTPEYLLGIRTFARRFFESLFVRLKTPSVLVFDNYQDAPSESDLHEIIQAALSNVPEGIQIVLISRNEPPPALIRLQANNGMAVLGWNDLRLDFGEIEELVRVKQGKKPGTDLLRHLHETTDGWAAGLVLMMEHPHFKALKTSSAPVRSREDVFKYFAVEVFEQLKSESRDFLLKTAYLPKITSTMACRLTGLTQSDRILEDLSHHNFFTIRLSLHEAAYQYHPLFRDFLLDRASNAFSSEHIAALKRNVACVLEEAGEREDAVGCYLQSGGWPEAACLICTLAPVLLMQGRAVVVKSWVDRVPASVADRIPYLYYWRGICSMMMAPYSSRLDFDKALDLFRANKDRAGMFLSWAGAVDNSFLCAEFAQLDRLIDLLKSLIDENPEFPSREIEARVSVGMFNALAWRRPHDEKIGFWEAKTLIVLKTCHDLDLRVKSGVYLTVYYLWKGEFAKADNSVSALRATAEKGKTPSYLLLNVKQLEAMYAFFTAEVDTCLKLVFKYVELAEQTGIHIWDTLVMENGISAALSMGDISLADSLFKRICIDPSNTRQFDTAFYHFLSTWKLMLEGDLRTALERYKEATASEHGMSFVPASAVGYIVMYEMLQESGSTKEAGRCLSTAYQIAHGMKSSLLEYMGLVAEAHQVFRNGYDTQGLALIKRAFAIGREFEIMNMYWWRPAVMSILCAKALDVGIETEYVQKLIRKRGLVPEENAPIPDDWPYPLRINTLGAFNLVKDGKPMVFSGKAQQKPLALLKALIAFGGKAVPEEQLTDALWPEADGYSAHRSCELALYRLRKLLGNDKAVQLHDEKLTLESRYCSVDVWAVERLFEQAEHGWKKIGQAGKLKKSKKDKAELESTIRLTEKALERYKGHFLSTDVKQTWTSSLRELMRSKFINHTSILGRYWEQAGDFERASDRFQKGLEIDELCEEFYQRLMVSYVKLGRKADAVTTYQRCRSKLATTLNITPSLNTEEIFHTLRTKK